MSSSQKKPSQYRRPRFEHLSKRINLAGDFQTDVTHLDVNGDLIVSPIDALIVINDENQRGPGHFDPTEQDAWLDTNGDGERSPIDALLPINFLNRVGSGRAPIAGEGESSTAPFYTGITTLDVDGNRFVDIQDALAIIRNLRQNGPGVFNPLQSGNWTDADGDGFDTILDALTVIRDLRAHGPHAISDPPLSDLPIVGYDMVLYVTEGRSISFVPAFIDPEQGPYSIGLSDIPDYGDLSVVDATWTYTPHGYDEDSFTFVAEDVGGHTASLDVTVHVQIGPGPHAPTAYKDTVSVVRNTPRAFNVLGNDRDVDGDTFSLVSHSNPEKGILEELGAGNFRYTPNVNVTGTDSFTYTIRDASGLESTAAVDLVIRLNNPPTALSPVIHLTEDMPSETFFPAEIGSDPDLDELSFTFGTPAHGVIVRNEGGWRYAPDVNFTGTDSVSYDVSDGFASTTGVLTFIVSEPHFVGPTIRRDEAIFVGVTLSGVSVDQETASSYEDMTPSSFAFLEIEEARDQQWIQDGFAVGTNFYPGRMETLGENALLIVRIFNLQGPDFVSAALQNRILSNEQSNRLADNITADEFWRMFAVAKNPTITDDATLETIAEDIASQFR